LEHLEIRDATTKATLSGTTAAGTLALAFRGLLRRETVDQLLVENPYFHGSLDGDFTAQLILRNPRASTVQGTLRVRDVEIPRQGGPPLLIEAATVRGEGKRLDLDSFRIALAGQRATLKGRVDVETDRFHPELTLIADELDGEALTGSLGVDEKDSKRLMGKFWDLPVQGSLRLDVARLRYGRFLLSPLRAEARLDSKRVTVTSSEVGLCGIDLPGQLEITPGGGSLELRPGANGADLQSSLDCLGHQTDLITGVYRLNATANARTDSARPRDLLRVAEGKFTFKAEDGRINRLGLLSKILAILNVTEIFRGRLPDLAKEGFGYTKIRSGGRVENGTLVFDESSIEGSSMNLFWSGSIDLTTRQSDLTVIVAPLKTVDAIISHIPIVRSILGKALLSVPVRVTGDIADPTIIPLSPTAVGRGILGFIERTLRLPYKLIQPLLPDSEP
jgi:hypothetical protein